jgi:hypothetical protein
MQWPFNREWYSHLKRGLRRPQVSHQKGMLRFEGITMAETPANAPFRGVGARVGHAWATPSCVATKHSPGAPALFPLLRLASLSPSYHSRLWRAFPRHCQLCSSVRCSPAAPGLPATGPRRQRRQEMRTLGRRSGVTVKI